MLSSENSIQQSLTKNGQKTDICIRFSTLLCAERVQYELQVNWRIDRAKKWFKPETSTMLSS